MRMRPAVQALLALCAILLTACGPKPEDDAMVRSFFEHIRAGEFDAIQDNLAPNLATPEMRPQFEALRRDYVPTDAPTRGRRINWSTVSIAGSSTTATFLHRYDYLDRVLLVTTSTRAAPGGPALVEGFHVNVTLLNGETAIDPTFSVIGATPTKLAFLAAMALSALLVLIGFFGTIFTPGFKRKWLFAIVALLGAPSLTMNWQTGEWITELFIGISLSLGFSATRGFGPFDPWMLKFTVPIGALIVLSLLWPRWTRGGEMDDV